jgi:hypothetical protein
MTVVGRPPRASLPGSVSKTKPMRYRSSPGSISVQSAPSVFGHSYGTCCNGCSIKTVYGSEHTSDSAGQRSGQADEALTSEVTASGCGTFGNSSQ